MKKNVIFDVGMVLLDFRYREFMQEHNFDLDFIEKFVARVINDIWSELDLGIREEEDIINEIKRIIPGYDREIDLVTKDNDDLVRDYDYAVPWIKSIKEAGYGVYILSNYPRTMWKQHSKNNLAFLPYVDGAIVSAFEKMAKPDPKIYKLAMERFDIKPEETIFFDDRIANVEAAKALGIDAHVFTSFENAESYLKEELPEYKGIKY